MRYLISRLGEFHQIYKFGTVGGIKVNGLDVEVKRSKVKVIARLQMVDRGDTCFFLLELITPALSNTT